MQLHGRASGRYEIDPTEVRDLAPEVLDENGRLKILPASYWAGTTGNERLLFGHLYGIYCFPTVELVEYLRETIGDRLAIEIGAGNGVLAEALGIIATDTHEQAKPGWRELIRLQGGVIVPYGPNVVEMGAIEAVTHYQPEVVIACWVTQNFDPKRPDMSAKYEGVDEEAIIELVDTYVMIGNEYVHRDKFIWDVPHAIDYPPWLYSRALNEAKEFIAIWDKATR